MLDFNHALTLEASKLCVRRRMMEPVQEIRMPRILDQTLLVRKKNHYPLSNKRTWLRNCTDLHQIKNIVFHMDTLY